ncbi:unnamed protein product [Cylindrotheca closterium]|uniref:MYND-type domain-containing protein n=1 Tax=Cylindrotheca closterium TaxID=2856 RepID=A0AAD2FVT2_9STRA|nr:unnamed protein product [Cylindrotheca closterium]
MDVVRSLGLEDVPEQQTRIGLFLSSGGELVEDVKVGFDVCVACGNSNPKIYCQACKRVKYCSDACKKKDTTPPDDDEEQALGHSSIVCTLLRTCNDDELVEGKEDKGMPEAKRTPAFDRVASEMESYPATLANIIFEGPCFQEKLQKNSGGEVEIHVIGTSPDSELWEGHPDSSQEKKVFKCYAEALSEMADRFKFESIQLKFIGPECPKIDMVDTILIPSMKNRKIKCKLNVMTKRVNYSKSLLNGKHFNCPDIVVFFNPGFTCPDYTWEEAVSAIPGGTPYLVTTNTELEGIADAQYLMENSFIAHLPEGLAHILEPDAPRTEIEDNETFFSINPFSGERVRQSGTMANDLYVKSRWILGGKLLGSESKESKTSKKRQKVTGSGNTKKNNPALI